MCGFAALQSHATSTSLLNFSQGTFHPAPHPWHGPKGKFLLDTPPPPSEARCLWLLQSQSLQGNHEHYSKGRKAWMGCNELQLWAARAGCVSWCELVVWAPLTLVTPLQGRVWPSLSSCHFLRGLELNTASVGHCELVWANRGCSLLAVYGGDLLSGPFLGMGWLFVECGRPSSSNNNLSSSHDSQFGSSWCDPTQYIDTLTYHIHRRCGFNSRQAS